MVECGPDEKDITKAKIGAQFGVGIITIIYIVFIMFIVGVIMSIKANISKTKTKVDESSKMSQVLNFVKSIGKGSVTDKSNYENNFTGRFTEWFTRVGNSINSGSVLAILAAGVVIGFNSLIMTPIISTMFPKDISQPIQIPGRVANVNPGQFFIALIGFILSLILFFFIAEVIHIIRHKFKKSLTVIIIIFLFLFLTFMLVWNGIELDNLMKQPDCVTLDTQINAFQLKNNGNIEHDQKYQYQYPELPSLPPFGIFG